MHVILETERMVLRRFTTDDLDLVFELDNDPEVMRFINGGEPVERSEVAETLVWWLRYYDRGDAYGFWAACSKEDDAFLGWFHFRPRAGRPREPELGYRLCSSHWGRGFAAEGSQALIDRGFEHGDIDRVVAETMVVHTASRRVMEKVGMHIVRIHPTEWPVRLPGDELGDVEYAIDRDDWIAGCSSGSP